MASADMQLLFYLGERIMAHGPLVFLPNLTYTRIHIHVLLFSGEHVIGEVDSVLKFTPFSDGKQGISGKLYATNYRISFITADRSSYDMVGQM